jgi:hypothetical protein
LKIAVIEKKFGLFFPRYVCNDFEIKWDGLHFGRCYFTITEEDNNLWCVNSTDKCMRYVIVTKKGFGLHFGCFFH